MKNFPQIAMFVIAGLVIAGNAQSFSPSAVDLPTLNLSAGNYIDFTGNQISVTEGSFLKKAGPDSASGGTFTFNTDIYLTDNGRIGIGSSTPSAALVVTGDVLPGDTNSSLGSEASPWKDLWVSSSTIYVGNLKLSESSEGGLTIVNKNTPTANVGITAGVQEVVSETGFIATTSLPDGGDWTLDSTLNFIASGTSDSLFAIDKANGRVGIGTTNPASLLDLSTTGSVIMSRRNVTWTTGVTGAPFGAVLKTSGDMTDGFGPGMNFYIEDDASGEQAIGTLAVVRDGADNSGAMVFQARKLGVGGTAERMRITSDGNVGIGTTSPEAKLNVHDGSIYLTDSDVSHGMIGIVPSSTFVKFGPLDADDGGMVLAGYSDTDSRGVYFSGVIGSNNPTDTTSAVFFSAAKKSGTSVAPLASEETAFGFDVDADDSAEIVMLGDSRVGINTNNPGQSQTGVLANVKLDVLDGDVMLSELSSTASDKSELAFYRRGDTALGSPITTGYNMGALSWYGSSNDNSTAEAPVRIYAKASSGTWTTGSNRKADLHFNVGREAEIDAMTIKNDGNVGIGTTTPNALAHLYQVSGNNAELDIQSVTGADKHWAIYQDRTTEDLRFWNNTPSGEKNVLVLDTNGNIGIGTTSPVAALDILTTGSGIMSRREVTWTDSNTGALLGLALKTSGDMTDDFGPGMNFYIEDDAQVENSIASLVAVRDGADNSGKFILETRKTGANTGKLTMNSDGNIGIGTLTPQEKLDINGANYIRFNPESDGDGIYSNNSEFSMKASAGNGKFIFYTGGRATENRRMIIDENGNVGIGTTSPWGKFSVTGSGTGTGKAFVVADSANDTKFVIQDDGRIGIGTTAPGEELVIRGSDEVFGATQAAGGDSRSGYVISNDARGWIMQVEGANNDNFEIFDNSGGGARMVVNTTGNVGIGTTTPSSKLVVESAGGGGGSDFTAIFNSKGSNEAGVKVAGLGTGGQQLFYVENGSAAPQLIVQANSDICGPDSDLSNCSSDRRLKQEIKSTNYLLEDVLKLNPVTFEWNKLGNKLYKYPLNEEQIGFVAQEVEEVMPDWVTMDDKGYRKVDDGMLKYALLDAIKELNVKVERQAMEIKLLKESE